MTEAREAERRLLDPGRRAGTMVWVMAIMLFLTVLAAALGLATLGAARGLDRQLAGRVTVQLLRADDATVARVTRAARTLPAVTGVRAVPRAELAKLLEPWLSDAGLDADLPMPALIDVELDDPTALTELQARIADVAPDARVDANAEWLAPIRGFILSLAWLAGALVVLMAAATAAIVILAARAGLDTHRNTIDVLHMLGSTDIQVARLFQRRIALDTLIGGVAGAAAALAVIALLAARVAALDAAALGGIALGVGDWALLAALPLLFVLLAMLAARIAVLGTLRQVL